MQTLPDRQQNVLDTHLCFVATTMCLRFLLKYAKCFNLHEGVVLSKHVTHYGPLKFSVLLPYNPPLPRDRSPYTPYGDAVCSHVGVISGNLYKSGINI